MFDFLKSKQKSKVGKAPKRVKKTIAFYEIAHPFNKDGGIKRNPGRIEVAGEESYPNLDLRTRYKAIDIVRDLARNSSLLRNLVNQLQLNVIGNSADLQFFDKTGDDAEWYRNAEKLFRKWAKHADFRNNGPLTDLLDKILWTLICEGDCVLIFDSDITGSGKILMIPPDQIAPLNDGDFSTIAKDGWNQVDGVIRDKFGRTIGVVCAPRPGMLSVPKDEAMILLKDDPYQTVDWIYVKRSFRDTVRGVADALPILTDLMDAAEILGYEKMSAKRFAAQYAYIKEAPAESAITPEGFIDEDEDQPPEGTENTTETEEKEYEVNHLQDVTGGMLDLLPNGSDVEFSPNDRPSPRTMEFVEVMREMSGASLGITRSYALGKADTSYSAARWESGLANKQFSKLAKWLDDNILDWIADRFINWAISKNMIGNAPDEDWVDSAAFMHPRFSEVLDESKIASANTANLRAGLTNLQEILGPQWRSYIDQLATEKKFAEERGLHLSSLSETANGSIIEDTPTESTEEENN